MQLVTLKQKQAIFIFAVKNIVETTDEILIVCRGGKY